jgi:adenylate cyclase
VSRSHARVDWHGGSFQLSDLSYNGTYVRLPTARSSACAAAAAAARQRRHRPGRLARRPDSACVRFEVLRFGDTQPQPLALTQAALPRCTCSTSTTTASTLLFENACRGTPA